MESKQLLVKIKIGKHGEMRRASFPLFQRFDEFKNAITAFLDLPSRPQFANGYKIKYEDEDGDLISLYNDQDLSEALRQVNLSEDKLLRLTVTALRGEKSEEEGTKVPIAKSPARRCPAFAAPECCHPFGPLGGLLDSLKVSLPEILKNPALRAMAEGVIGQSQFVKVMTNFQCDVCNVQICGDRYNSTSNPNFDLCSACFAQVGERLNAEHKFHKVSALDALVECLTNGGTFDAAFEQGPAAPEQPNRHNAVCDLCDGPIVGIRHKCLDCADYDECNLCHTQKQRNAHADGSHGFYAIEDPAVRAVPEEIMAVHRSQKQAAEARRLAEEAEKKAKVAAEEAARVAALRLQPAPAVQVAQPRPVAPPAEQPKEIVPEESQREPSAFEKNLQTLESMGFTDRKRCIQVLVRNRNRLFESIQELLN